MMSDEELIQPIVHEVDVYLAVSRGRELARRLGFDHIDRTRIEIAILELTRNILVHAHHGQLGLRIVLDQLTHRQGLEITARDQGPGIADTELALRDGYSTAHTLGAGLPGVRRLMHEFQLESVLNQGTTVRAIRWLPQGGR